MRNPIIRHDRPFDALCLSDSAFFETTGLTEDVIRMSETDAIADIGAVHVAQALTNMSVGYKNRKFIAELIAPVTPTDKLLDKYYTFGKEAFRTLDDTYMPGATPKEISWAWNTATFQCTPHATRAWYPTMSPTVADAVIKFDIVSTRNVSQAIQLRQELNLLAALKTSLNPASMVAAGVNFDNPGFDPVPWIAQQKRVIARATGETANVLALGRPAWDALASNPNFLKHIAVGPLSIDLLPGTQITPAQAAQKLELDEILVGDCLYDTAATPADTANLQYVWDDYVLLFVRAPAMGEQIVTLATHFLFSGGTEGQMIRKWYDQDKYRQVIDGFKFYVGQIVVSGAGIMWSNAITAQDQPSGEV